jgi:hypothetical protein
MYLLSPLTLNLRAVKISAEGKKKPPGVVAGLNQPDDNNDDVHIK